MSDINSIVFDNNEYRIFKGNCIEHMNNLPENSINLILTDLPYGTTRNKWDTIIPLDIMWESFDRILNKNGVVVLTAAQPFASMLVTSNIKMFRYDLIWGKTISSGQMNIKHQPLRSHEHILIFYNTINSVYNEQKTEGLPYKIKRRGVYKPGSYNIQSPTSKDNDGYRHAKSVIEISNPRIKGGHPTQKPLLLFNYLVRTYSNKRDVVLDCCMGSGTTGEACLRTDRKFIGIEKDKAWFKHSQARLAKVYGEYYL